MRLSSGTAAATACLAMTMVMAMAASPAGVPRTPVFQLARKQTSVPAQPLKSALQELARERNFHLVYFSDDVNDLRCDGTAGELTIDEALTQLLRGTGLAFRYLNDTTVTLVQVHGQLRTSTSAASDEPATVQGNAAGVTALPGK